MICDMIDNDAFINGFLNLGVLVKNNNWIGGAIMAGREKFLQTIIYILLGIILVLLVK